MATAQTPLIDITAGPDSKTRRGIGPAIERTRHVTVMQASRRAARGAESSKTRARAASPLAARCGCSRRVEGDSP